MGNMEVIDYMAEYRTIPELILTGVHDDGTWTLEVAKVGGGTLGRCYPAGEHWIINSFVCHELMESVVVAPTGSHTHLEVANTFASCWFGM
jgi:hypothetical protein